MASTLQDFLTGSLGKTSIDLNASAAATGSSGSTAVGTTYPRLADGVLIDLVVQGKISAVAAIVLGRQFTLVEAQTLWNNNDIVDEATYKAITGQDPPVAQNRILYGTWQPSPSIVGAIAPIVPSYTYGLLPQSETFKFVNTLRPIPSVQVRPTIGSDGDTYPPALGLDDVGVSGRIITSSIKVTVVRNGSRQISFAGMLVRFVMTNSIALPAGAYEWRYKLELVNSNDD